jgi:predicted dehydrogenase
MESIRFGIIGLGLMGKEFASALARWCNLDVDLPRPLLHGICSANPEKHPWYKKHFPDLAIITADYHELLESDAIDAIYCAVPHHLHETLYQDIIQHGKHLLGEKPFGMDLQANKNILRNVQAHPDVLVRCTSEFPYYPAAQRLIDYIQKDTIGDIIEMRVGFHHASDLDVTKPINWKRQVKYNGEYGCMGDLGMHVLHIPLRLGIVPTTVYAELQNLVEMRPDETGRRVPCDTWDNATLLCSATQQKSMKRFPFILETKRLMPGATNTWFLEVYGTNTSVRFSTHDPRAFYLCENRGKEQAWARLDMGMQTVYPVVTGRIFECGFSDVFQQMIAAFIRELAQTKLEHTFDCVYPDETLLSHYIFTAALDSYKQGTRVEVGYYGK